MFGRELHPIKYVEPLGLAELGCSFLFLVGGGHFDDF